MVSDPSKFAKEVMSQLGPQKEFSPSVYHSLEGDSIEFIGRPGAFYAERLDDLVTVYISEESGKVIGSLISGIRGLRKTLGEHLPGFVIQIDDGRVKLEHIFLAGLWIKDRDEYPVVVHQYQKLIEVAEETNAEAELQTV